MGLARCFHGFLVAVQIILILVMDSSDHALHHDEKIKKRNVLNSTIGRRMVPGQQTSDNAGGFASKGRYDIHSTEAIAREPTFIAYHSRANALWTQFMKSGRLDDMKEVIVLRRQALKLLPASDPNRTICLSSLASALWTQFEQLRRYKDLEEAIALHRQAAELISASHPDRPLFLTNLASALLTQFEQSGQVKVLDEVIVLHRQAIKLLPRSHPYRSMSLTCLASALSTRFTQFRQGKDLEEAISFHRKALKLLPASHRDRYIYLNRLASALSTQFTQSGRTEDLEEAISLHRETLNSLPTPHPNLFMYLTNLASALSTQFEQSRRDEDLDEVIILGRQAIKLPSSYPYQLTSLTDLASALSTRFERLGRGDDLQEAISLHRRAVGLPPASHDLPMALCSLASVLWTRFQRSGQDEDLEEVIRLHRKALQPQPAPHPDPYKSVTKLASALSERFTRSGRDKDLENAISLFRQALNLRPAPHPDRYTSLTNLALALSTSTPSGQGGDLEEPISLYQQALELLPVSHPDRSVTLNNFASTLLTRFTRSSQANDLKQAILYHKQALELRPASHPDRSMSLHNLASALFTQYIELGRRDDLDEAIKLIRQALSLGPASNSDRSKSLSNLALTLRARYEESGQSDDMKEAISLQRDALKLRPASHPDRSISLSNLASTLWRQYEQLGRDKDLEEAISLHKEALTLRHESHPDRSKSLTNLALALWTRSMRSGRGEGLEKDLEDAISLYQQALQLLPDKFHPDRPMCLSNLALALSTRFKLLAQPKDLKEAIVASEQSLDILASGHPLVCLCLRNQGSIYLDAYSYTKNSEYLDEAMNSFRLAVSCKAAPASKRFQVAKEWANHADGSNFRHDSALEAYRVAIELLPRLAMLGLDLPSRQKALSGSDGLARAAAACAIRLGQYDKAVELLEEGRAVFWSQSLQLRTPMNALGDVAPKLRDKFQSISFALERGSRRNVSRSLLNDTGKMISVEEEATHFRRLGDEWLETLKEVRRLKGFQDFLRPNKISTLLGAASEAPLVILNASDIDCAALILTSSGVQHVPLPHLTFPEVTRLVKLIQIVTVPGSTDVLSKPSRDQIARLAHQMPLLPDTSQDRHMIKRDFNKLGNSDDVFQSVLGVLWKSAVEPVIRQLGLTKSGMQSNLRWCPTGLLTFLPLHAAGIYDTKEPECVFEYVCSSYTPTISALLRDMPLPSTQSTMVVVTQPELRYTRDELQRIETRVPVTKAQMPVMNLVKLVSRTVEDVASHLTTASIAHFACHGKQDAQEPLKSALLLNGGHPLTVSRIMQLHIPNARLAFLAACQTALGDKTLPDEVIHLGSTLLFSGFPGVVATMWNISDADGPGIADTFYEYLFKGANPVTGEIFQPDTTRAARGLHLAVAKLRSEKNVSFKRWVPFIHLGR